MGDSPWMIAAFFQDWIRMQERVGYMAMFPFFQPENFPLHLNLRVYEQRPGQPCNRHCSRGTYEKQSDYRKNRE